MSLWAMNLLSLPVGALLAFATLLAWTRLVPRLDISFAPTHQIVAALLAVMLSGLCLQVLTHPGMGLRRSSVIGLWLSRLTPYTACLCKLSKQRAIASLLLPFVVMVVLPALIASIFKLDSGWLVFGSCVAAAFFGMHAFLAVSLAYQVPSGGLVAGRGFQIYWHPGR